MRRTALTAATALVLVAGVGWVVPTGLAGAAPPPPGPTGTARSVTLITGDRVTVTAGRVGITPGTGREGMRFDVRRTADSLRVVPADALPLLRQDRLDARLFDVSGLLRAGYGDPRADLPLIVTNAGAPRGSVRGALSAAGARPGRDLPLPGAVAVKAAKGGLGALWAAVKGDRPGAAALAGTRSKVWLDGKRALSLDVSVPLVGAPVAWAAGADGSTMTVAVLDSGIDATHPDLTGRVTARNFTEGEEDDRDLAGHGTHVASTIAGDGTASGGRYKGVAPRAKLLDAKVCIVDGCAESWILAGMQWAAEQGASVANLSLGGPDLPGLDPVEEAVQALTAERGVLFVAAAGNNGADASIDSPASADAAVAVGAVTKAGALAAFSSRGPRTGDGAVKPDLTAPGVDITAARGRDSGTGPPDRRYVTASGTSMATPHVSGGAALLRQLHPQWTPEQVKAALTGSAQPNPALGVFAQGTGRLDLARAVRQPVLATPGSVSFGEQRWPHADDEPVTRPVTYRNDGSAPLTLTLAVTATGPGGAPAPAGLFRVEPATVTVPAGGKATATLTADTRAGTLDGAFAGLLRATGDGVVVSTAVAVRREVESYDLTLAHTGRDGQPPALFSTTVTPHGSLFDSRWVRDDSVTTLRLPKGRYTVVSKSADADTASLLVQPTVVLDGDRRVELDARLARPVEVTLPDPAAAPLVAEVTARVHAGVDTLADGLFGQSFSGMHTGRIGPPEPGPVTTVVGGRWARPGPDGSVLDSPEVYALNWFPGPVPTGFSRQVQRRDLATVRGRFASQADGAVSAFDTVAVAPNGDGSVLSYSVPMRAPFTRVTYHNTDGGVRWVGLLAAEGLVLVSGPSTAYRAGREYAERWNTGVFGPSRGRATRTGDDLWVNVGLYGDGAGRSGHPFAGAPEYTLTRDGVPVAAVDREGGKLYAVPPAAGTYRLTVEGERGAPATLSTRVTGTWTFRSAHTDPATSVPLPLSFIRLSPGLDDRNSAPAGRRYPVPVTVTRQDGSAATGVRAITVDVSFDDGVTWRPAPLAGHGHRAVATLTHPDGDGFASLRVTATLGGGCRTELTVIRAYRIAAARPDGSGDGVRALFGPRRALVVGGGPVGARPGG